MTATSTGMTRMESFPFDSKADGYDADGYPVYDRAVGASMFRTALGKIFTNGVFGTPADALQIGKGTTGLTVTVQPGIAIINGAMGGVDGEDPLTLTLDTASPQGNVCYAIMLRYDNTDERRSLYFNVVRGDASSTPQPPTPDTTTPEVYEIRLGYVTVPSNATDLSEATVVNEKGTDACPYAMPFEEVDLSQIVADAQATASEGLESFNEFLSDNRQFVQDAIDGTTAGNLQNQIDDLKNNSFSPENVDNSTLEFSPTSTSQGENVLRVKDAGITAEKMADGSVGTSALQDASVTNEKLADGAVTSDKLGLSESGGALPPELGGTGVSYHEPVFSMYGGSFRLCKIESLTRTDIGFDASAIGSHGSLPTRQIPCAVNGNLVYSYLFYPTASSSNNLCIVEFASVSSEGVASAYSGSFAVNGYFGSTETIDQYSFSGVWEKGSGVSEAAFSINSSGSSFFEGSRAYDQIKSIFVMSQLSIEGVVSTSIVRSTVDMDDSASNLRSCFCRYIVKDSDGNYCLLYGKLDEISSSSETGTTKIMARRVSSEGVLTESATYTSTQDNRYNSSYDQCKLSMEVEDGVYLLTSDSGRFTMRTDLSETTKIQTSSGDGTIEETSLTLGMRFEEGGNTVLVRSSYYPNRLQYLQCEVVSYDETTVKVSDSELKFNFFGANLDVESSNTYAYPVFLSDGTMLFATKGFLIDPIKRDAVATKPFFYEQDEEYARIEASEALFEVGGNLVGMSNSTNTVFYKIKE